MVSLFCALLIPCIHIYRTWKDNEKHHRIIVKNKVKDQNYTEIPYIDIPRYQIHRIIKESTDPKILGQNYVGIWNVEKDVRKTKNIVLAGHNVKNVFAKLHQIQKEDEIIIHYKDQIYTYKVLEKKIIDVTEMHYLQETKDKRVTLITCTNDDQKRLLVIGTYKKSS